MDNLQLNSSYTISIKNDLLDISKSFFDNSLSNISIVYINIERFRSINEILGRTSGDSILNMLFYKLVKLLPDLQPIHLYADSFAVLTQSEEESIKISNLILDVFRAPVDAGTLNFYLNLKIGIASTPLDDDFNIESLLTDAESAIAFDKYSTPEQIHLFDKSRHAISHNHIQIEHEIRESIENDDFIVFLQPKVSPDGKLLGAEALIRWDHPTNGILPPGMFIELAEESWLISDLTKIVYRKTIDAIKELSSVGIDIPISFNMSTKVLSSDISILPYMTKLAESSGLADKIEMEIVESALLNSSKSTNNALNNISELGIKISLDDFGTGFSSFAYLYRYPISAIKIDRMFISGEDVEYGKIITEAIANLANKLNLLVIAEGVETKEQLDWVAATGISQIQGFYFSKPLPLKIFIEKYSIT
jgi:EAL domain-containing protein (putative c-di-GMP-specific phosphodiesterase class I)/GGDEF domain-containing protein